MTIYKIIKDVVQYWSLNIQFAQKIIKLVLLVLDFVYSIIYNLLMCPTRSLVERAGLIVLDYLWYRSSINYTLISVILQRTFEKK